MNCNTTHYRANSSSVPGDPTKLEQWIEQDRKEGVLKELQGLIWQQGYVERRFQGHVYDDVKPFFENIRKSNHQIAIYSSGSVQAQKLIFAHSASGDLTPYISHYFDTKVGHKREAASYQKIAQELKVAPSEIHFFSDIPQELQAAREAGMQVTHVRRPGTANSDFECITDFSQAKL